MNYKTLIEIEDHVSQLEAFVASQVVVMDPNDEVRNLRQDPRIQAALRHYKVNLARLAQIQTAVTQAGKDLQCQYDQLKYTLAPIRACPPEILGEIFSQGLCFNRPGHPSGWNATWALKISQICQEWRAVALNRSGFWTCIRTDWSNFLQREFLARSRQSPLHISSYSSLDEFGLMYREPDYLVQEASHRWRTLSADWYSCKDNITLLQQVRSLDALESVYVLCDMDQAPSEALDMGRFRSPLPRLTSLAFSNHRIIGLRHIAVHLKNLDLGMVPMTRAEWVLLPEICPDLETLSVKAQDCCRHSDSGDDDYEDGTNLNFPVVTLPKLHTLSLHRRNDARFNVFFFQHIRIPELRNFALSLDDDYPDDRVGMYGQHLRQFVQASPSIERVALSEI